MEPILGKNMEEVKIEEKNVDKMPPCEMLYTLYYSHLFLLPPSLFSFLFSLFSFLLFFSLALPFPVDDSGLLVEFVGNYSMGIKWTALDPSVSPDRIIFLIAQA